MKISQNFVAFSEYMNFIMKGAAQIEDMYLIFIQNYFKRLRSLSEHYNWIDVNHT